MSFTLEDLTLGDVEEVEKYAGQPLASLADAQANKGRLMTALAYVIKRKEDPKFSMEQAKQLPMSEITELLNQEDPTKE